MKSKLISSPLPAVLIASAASLFLLGHAHAAPYYSSKSSYADPDGTTSQIHKQRGPCSDPWVTIALINVYGKAESSRCNIKLYNGGNWRNFNELQHAVAKAGNFPTVDVSQIKATKVDSDTISVASKNGVPLGQFDNGRLTVSLPPNMVAAGGGNMVAAGAGNMVAAGAGNLTDAVKDVLEKSNPPVSFQGGGYGLQSAKNFNDLKNLSKKK